MTTNNTLCLSKGDIYIPLKIEEDNIYDGIIQLLATVRPEWDPRQIKFKNFTDGITNKLIGCQLLTEDKKRNNMILVRIYGNKTDLLIDRKAELRNIRLLHSFGLAPKVYGAFENGLTYEYLPGKTLDPDTVIMPHIWSLVAQQMAKMHKILLPKEFVREAVIWDKIEQFLALLPEPFSDPNKHKRFVKSFGSLTKLRMESEKLKSLLSRNEFTVVFAHNDLLLGNVIYNEEKKTVSFIDYEYAAYNYQAFDMANHFNEFVGITPDDIDYKKYPSKEFQLAWIETYLNEFSGETSSEQVLKLYNEVQQMSLVSNFFWGLWSLVQFELSHIDFDFGRYAESRLFRYFETKDEILKNIL